MEEIQPAPVEVQAKHYAGVLRQAVRAAGFSVSEVERRLGTGPKNLRRVFDGSVDLKFKHVVAVLRIIGMSEQEFFAIASRTGNRRRRGTAGSELLASFARLGYQGKFLPTDDDLEKTPSAEELDRQVEEAVERVIQRRAQQGKVPPATSAEPLLDQEEEGDPVDGEPE